jgi:hypothetical protein
MKQMIGGSGSDTTAAALTYLTTHHMFRQADLYLIGEVEDPNAIWLTNWESPLVYSQYGTFQPASISRGTVSTKIGLEVSSLEIKWSPPLTAFGSSPSTANAYQKAWNGVFRNWRVRVWRTIMPTPGDANTYGAYELFGGRVAQVQVQRGSITITANSFLDCINEQVPPNVIEATNILAGYAGATPVLADSETALAEFNIVAPTDTSNLLAVCTGPSANKIYGLNKLQFGYIVFAQGSTMAGYYAQIGQNDDFNAGGGVHYNQFLLYGALPFAPAVNDSFFVSAQFPLDQTAAQAAGVFRGFPYVPAPESAV